MNERIAKHVNELFSGAPNNKATVEIREELLANLNDKYNDLISGGADGESAFAQTISGIGDIQSLLGFAEQQRGDQISAEQLVAQRQKRSVFISIGVSLYIISLAVASLFSWLALEYLAGVSFLIICAAATGMIVYGNTLGGGKYTKVDNTFAEEYKEKLTGNTRKKKLLGAASSSLWSFTIVAYLAYSFLSWRWDTSWIIFIIAACAQQILSVCFSSPAGRRKAWHGVLWTFTLILYFAISFWTWHWEISWLIFVAAAAVEQIVRLVILWREPQ